MAGGDSEGAGCRLRLRLPEGPRALRRTDVLWIRLRDPGGVCPLCGMRLVKIRGVNIYYCFNCKLYVY